MIGFNSEKCFEEYKACYQKLLKKYYPAHRSTGFTERNQSVNFTRAVSAIYPMSFSWFEAALIKPKQHMDVVIFVPEIDGALLVESKRFSTPHSKVKSVAEDIQRLCDKNNHQTLCSELKGEYRRCKQNIYGIILADVWLENDMKNEIYDFWDNGFFEKFKDLCPVPAETIRDMNNKKWFKTTNNDFDDLKYRLLALMFQIM